MCMKNRFSKVSRSKVWILILLAVSGVTSSCKDEYLLDDEKPSWLGSSIYEKLQKGQYSYYMKLLADPDVNNAEDADNNRGWIDVLSKTGSKTLFVANDDAWEKFFQDNALLDKSDPWSNATSYKNLSAAQKKLLLHTSMLNNAIVSENLSSSGGGTSARGELLRRNTDVETTDTITYISGDDLPVNYNIAHKEKDLWKRFRTENGGKGIYLVTDSTPSMMIHFTNEYLARNQITSEDFRIFANQERATRDVHIYNHRVLKQDDVCENGYINVTDGVLKPLACMAEQLRTNGKTRIYSHMIDRWSAPYYSPTITRAYQGIMASKGIEWKDSIYVKRYISERSFEGKALGNDPDGEAVRDSAGETVALKFDPAWNGYYAENSTAEKNMSTMFVALDDAMWEYFSPNGSGWQLIRTYSLPDEKKEPAEYQRALADLNNTIAAKDYDKLFRYIDQIPRSALSALLNVGMFSEFTASVPSKMTKLRDDASEQLFYEDDIDHVVGSLMASNGIIYLTDKVYGPADYTSVTAPAYITKDKLVMRWAIYNGYKPNTESDLMHLNYYAYLKAMKSRFAFLLPNDEGMKYVYDPISFKSLRPRVLEFTKITPKDKATMPIEAVKKLYTVSTGEIGDEITSYKIADADIVDRLKDVMESHTIVLDSLDEIDTDVDEYYLAKNGAPVKVTRKDGKIVRVQGGFQIDNEEKGLPKDKNKGVTENKVVESYIQQNGRTYVLDSPIVNTPHSVWSIFTNNGSTTDPDPDFYDFYLNFCSPVMEIINACGLADGTTTEQTQKRRKYQIFSQTTPELAQGKAVDENVTFFSNYRYTIFVPSPEALEDAITNKKLPTWTSIQEDYDNCEKDGKKLKNQEDIDRLQAKITCLTNFVRYHFIDNSVFVDQSKINAYEAVTASYDKNHGLFNKIMIKRENGVLQVKDVNGGDWVSVGGRYNVMARDVFCNAQVANASMDNKQIKTSSFAVIHQIPAVLNHAELKDGTYESLWASSSECRKYLKRYAIK